MHGAADGPQAFLQLRNPRLNLREVALVDRQNLGAGKPERAIAGVRVASQIGLVVAAVVGAMVLLSPWHLLAVFGMTDPLVLGFSTPLLRYLSVSGFFVTVALSYTGGLQGTGDTRSPLYISILSQVIIPLGLCMLFQATTGLEARYIWMAILVGHVTRCGLSVARFRQQKWLGIAVDIEPPEPRLMTVEAQLPGAEPHIPMRDAPDPAARS